MTILTRILDVLRGWRHLGFPLLMKELTEQANRRRTYVVRFAYAAALFALGVHAIAGEAGSDVRIGAGGAIFGQLVQMQFWLVLIFLPATASGALTMEKERNSLSLLLLTTIPPWSIVLQKYLSRLVPMLSFLLLSFPLMAVAYNYGGVDAGELTGAIALLLLFAAQVAAAAIVCSSYCRTTGEAFIATYVLLGGLALFGVWPPTHFGMLASQASPMAAAAQVGMIVVVGSIVTCLFLACVFLEPRAFVPPRNVLLQLFQRLDRFYNDLNHVTGGIVLVDDRNQLPSDKPIAWRETAKKSLGTARYLFRVLTVLEVPILFVGSAVNINMVRERNAVTGLLYVLWIIAAAMLCVHASGVITAERSRQTLDSLLTAPLTGAEILKQKMAGVRRLIGVLLVPFGSIYAFQMWFRGFDIGYALGSFGTAFIFLPLIAWGSLWIGLHLQGTMRAVLASMFTVLLVCGLPIVGESLLFQLIADLDRSALPWADLSEWVGNFSPVNMIVGIESRGVLHNRMGEFEFWFYVAVLPLYGVALVSLRSACLRHADRLLKRLPEDPTAPIDPLSANANDGFENPLGVPQRAYATTTSIVEPAG